MLQFNSMYSLKQKRGVFSGFSLIEILIVLVLIGIIGSLLIPKLLETREEALRQAARQQVKIIENALADWFNAQPTIAGTARLWGTGLDADADGFANTTQLYALIRPYLATQGHVETFPSANFLEDYAYTSQMQEIEGASFIGGAANTVTGVNHAYIRFYWRPDNAATTNINERIESAPKIVFFLPSI